MYAQVTETTSPGMTQALAERKTALEARAAELLQRAAADRAPWLAALGLRPADRDGAIRWTRAALAIAAYRERYGVPEVNLLGVPATLIQRRDAGRIHVLLAQPAQPQHQQAAPTVGHRQDPSL
jgi:hypothetical protein